MAADYEQLRSLWLPVKDAGVDALYSGLQRYGYRLHKHLLQAGQNAPPAERFQTAFNSAARFDKMPDEESNNVVVDMAAHFPAAAMKLLVQPHEAIAAQGKALFDGLVPQIKPTICSTQGVMGALYKGLVNTDELPILIATHILEHHFNQAPHWYPLALLLGSIIHRLDVEQFCTPEKKKDVWILKEE